MLSGSLATFLHWASRAEEAGECQAPGAEIIAAWGAARLTRACAELAFTQCGRSSTTTDMIGVIHQVSQHSVCVNIRGIDDIDCIITYMGLFNVLSDRISVTKKVLHQHTYQHSDRINTKYVDTDVIGLLQEFRRLYESETFL